MGFVNHLPAYVVLKALVTALPGQYVLAAVLWSHVDVVADGQDCRLAGADVRLDDKLRRAGGTALGRRRGERSAHDLLDAHAIGVFFEPKDALVHMQLGPVAFGERKLRGNAGLGTRQEGRRQSSQ